MNDLKGITVLGLHHLNWIKVSQIRYTREFSRPLHEHASPCMQLMLSGCFLESGWDQPTIVSPGEALLRPAGFLHANPISGNESFALSLQFDEKSWPAEIAEYFHRIGPMRTKQPFVATLSSQIKYELAVWDELSAVAIEGLCTQIIVQMLRVAGRGRIATDESRLVELAEEIIRCRLSSRLTVGLISEEIGLDRFALNRAFLKYRGRSPSDTIRLFRIELAQRLLGTTQLPLIDVAQQCGFSDQSHMNRVFVATVGQTPKQCRMHYRNT